VLTVHRLLWLLVGRRPVELVAGAVLLSVAGVVAGAGISALAGRRREARALAREGLFLTLAFVAFCVSDWALLRSLPRLRLSFSPDITLPLVTSLFVRTLVFWGMLAAAPLAHWRREHAPRGQRQRRKGLALSPFTVFLAANLAFSAVQVDAYVVEPLAVETTRLTLSFDDLDAGMPPVRVVQLTDTHIERSGPREATVIRQVNALKPDLIVLTGDYLNLSYLSDPTSAAHFRQFLAQLQAPYGVYAVRGSLESPEEMAWLLEGMGVVWVEDELVTVDVREQRLTLVGLECSKGGAGMERLAEAMKGLPADAFTVLLCHTPDLIREAAGRGIDLYLAGHTHGGQIRLPFYGAVATGSVYGRRYVSGLFQESGTTMYVSRGIGFEGGGLPRARFLCRPEIVSIDLVGR
jgi:predicted MPP superfamily phosphohydrolase